VQPVTQIAQIRASDVVQDQERIEVGKGPFSVE